jgi:hypothetical protein
VKPGRWLVPITFTAAVIASLFYQPLFRWTILAMFAWSVGSLGVHLWHKRQAAKEHLTP